MLHGLEPDPSDPLSLFSSGIGIGLETQELHELFDQESEERGVHYSLVLPCQDADVSVLHTALLRSSGLNRKLSPTHAIHHLMQKGAKNPSATHYMALGQLVDFTNEDFLLPTNNIFHQYSFHQNQPLLHQPTFERFAQGAGLLLEVNKGSRFKDARISPFLSEPAFRKACAHALKVHRSLERNDPCPEGSVILAMVSDAAQWFDAMKDPTTEAPRPLNLIAAPQLTPTNSEGTAWHLRMVGFYEEELALGAKNPIQRREAEFYVKRSPYGLVEVIAA